MNKLFDMTFAHNYTCEETELSPPYNVLYFPRDSSAGSNGLLLKITPGGSPWTGLFASGTERGISRVLSLPDPKMLCVVARGHGYIINTEAPEQWENVEIDPIKQALSVATHELVILAGYTSVVAIGAAGIAWDTGRIAMDGLSVTGTIGGDLLIVCDDGEMSETIRIDLASGRVSKREPGSRSVS